MDEIITRKISLPAQVRGITVLDGEGDFNVYLNAALSESRLRAANDHERRHIKNDHFYNDDSVKQNEQEANNERSGHYGVK